MKATIQNPFIALLGTYGAQAVLCSLLTIMAALALLGMLHWVKTVLGSSKLALQLRHVPIHGKKSDPADLGHG
jgi:hypothetical protein